MLEGRGDSGPIRLNNSLSLHKEERSTKFEYMARKGIRILCPPKVSAPAKYIIVFGG